MAGHLAWLAVLLFVVVVCLFVFLLLLFFTLTVQCRYSVSVTNSSFHRHSKCMIIFCVTLSFTEKFGFDLKTRSICVHFSAAFYYTRIVWARTQY